MSTVDVLKAAKALIEDPERWTTKAWARDERGVPVDSRSPLARRWCALGAIYRQLHCVAALQILSWDNLVRTNDELGHAAVMATFDKAIKLAEAKR